MKFFPAVLLMLTVTAQADEAAPGGEAAPTSALQLRLDALSATRDRPLFAPDRRPLPPPAPSVAVTKPPDKKETPILRGVILSSVPAIVLLEDKATAQPIVVISGDTFGPWKIVAETDHSVSLREGDKKIVLDLFEQ